MPRENLLLQTLGLSLLGQSLPKHEKYGKLFETTSCLNNEEREMIGICWAVADLINDEDKATADELRKIIPFLETIGISKWPRTELTDLAIRVGERRKRRVKMTGAIPGKEPWEAVTEDDLIEHTANNATQ